MDAFHWIAVVLSSVLSLGVARILSGYVAAFRARHRVKQDWLPLVLAGVVLGRILHFWWALAELSTIKIWSLAAFTFLTALIVLLFLAAALIVPAESDMSDPIDAFERDGRWSLLALACYHIVAIFGNWWLFGHIRPLVTASLVALAALSLLIALTTNRRVQEVATILYVILGVAHTLVAVQLSYGS
jgi:hypothetical protein